MIKYFNFDVVAYGRTGKRVDVASYQTHKLNELNGHWVICMRMEERLRQNRKTAVVRTFFKRRRVCMG